MQALVHYLFDFFPNGINNSGAKDERITDSVRLFVSFNRKEENVPVQF